MGSKIDASIGFLESGGQTVIIANPGELGAALQGERGTTIVC